jgi:UDP:flavonoid glycosyltransferase YjiC (YdhE family)
MLEVKKVFEAVQPDVTICDWNKPMWLALQAWRPPCTVSILRCEVLLGYQRRNMFFMNKFPFENPYAVSWTNDCLIRVGLSPVSDWRNLCKADIIVVPSVPQLDPLPVGAEETYRESVFVYTGPLLLSAGADIPEALGEWIASCRQRGTPVVLVTLGTAWGSKIYRVLAEHFIMVVPDEKERRDLEQGNGPRFQAVGVIDLRRVIERVDLVVHHCGHGTVHSVLLGGKPSLTLPSGEYDREDLALRLEDLCCGRHLGHDFFRNGFDPHAFAAVANTVLTDSGIERGVAAMSSTVKKYVETRGAAALGRALESHPALQ